jgi:hypothetical protein
MKSSFRKFLVLGTIVSIFNPYVIFAQKKESTIQGASPNDTRLLFAPSARSLKAGQGYIGNYDFLFPIVAVGIADVISVAGGVTGMIFGDGVVYYFAPKFTPLQFQYLDVAIGALFIGNSEEGSFDAGITYALLTYGISPASITLGGGWGYTDEDVGHTPIFMIAGEFWITKNIKFITENWVASESIMSMKTEPSLHFFGLRFMDSFVCTDMAVGYPANSENAERKLIPWIGIAVNFDFLKH